MNLDAAAMHPEIGLRWDAPGKAYFKKAAALKERVHTGLLQSFGQRHELFLSGNTSNGLIAVCLAAARAGLSPPGLINRPYPPYEKLLGYPGLLQADRPLQVCTHICPLTGEVVDLRAHGDALLIVDAAQSLGTCFQQELVETAPVFVAPLHKHVNLVPGLGVVGVDFDALEIEFGSSLRTVLEVMEHGAVYMGVLEECARRLDERQDAASLNQVRIQVGERLTSTASQIGLRVLTPTGIQAHIASFTTVNDAPVGDLLDAARIGARIFKQQNIFRISLHSDVHGVRSPEDYESFVVEALTHAPR